MPRSSYFILPFPGTIGKGKCLSGVLQQSHAISLMIICIMCPIMSLVATLLFKEPSFGTWAHTFGCNLPMAFFWQMFYCGPLSRLIFRTLFKKQLAAQNTPAQGQK